MEHLYENRVFMCSQCGKEHNTWEGACTICGFKRSIRMSQAVVDRIKPLPYLMEGSHERRNNLA